MDNLNIPILNSSFRRVGMMMQEEYDNAKIIEDLSSGFPTFSLSLSKKDCEDVNKIENNSYCRIEDELFSLLSVDYEDEEVKEMTFEHWCVPFLQSDANEIEEPEDEEDISYYLTSTLQNTPIILGNIEVGARKKLAFNTQKVATRLQELYEEFEVEPIFRTEYHEFEKDRPMHIILDLVVRRGSKEPIILDSETNLIKSSYKSDKSDLITAIEVKPYIKEETVKKTVKTAQQSVEIEVEPGSASKTQKQLEYFTTQVGGRYSQGSARNQFKDSNGNIIRQAVADCSSMTHKALEYAGIDVGWNGSGWFYSTRDFRTLANQGTYFEVLGRWNDQSVWSKIEPGDLILINSPAHIVTWIGEGGNRDIFHAYGSPHAYTANWYKNNYETVMRPKNRGAARARKTKTEKVDSTLIGGSNKDQIWVHLKNIGFPDISAAAIMGNLYQESRYDPRAIQSGGPGRGLAQWSVGDRWQDLITFASGEGLDPWGIEAQTKFIHREMRYGYWSTRMNDRASWYGGSSGAHGYEAFTSVTDLTKATEFFCREYEVAGVEAMSIRVNEAKKIYKEYRGTYESGEDSSVTVGDTKYTTKEVSEKRLVTYSIKDIDYDDGNFYSHLGDEIIISRDAQDLYGFNRQNKSDYLLGIHEMTSSNTAAQFETALTTLKNRSQPFEEYYIDIGTTDPETREALKNAQLGDEVWTTSHGWDRERDLVLHARISEVTRLPNQRDNIRVKLTDAERIEVVFPPGMVAAQDRIRKAQAEDLDRMVVSLRSDVVNFIGSKEETEIRANVRTGQADLTNVIPDHEFRWQVYDKRGLPISETDEHDIIVGVGVNNSEGNAEWRTSELVTGRRYRIHPTIIGTEFKFHIYDDRGVLAEESDWFDDSEDVVYTASAVASYMVIETTSNVNTRSIQVFTEAVPLILEGKKVFIDADMVDERITVTCRVRDAEGSISISKTDFTPVGETPPADFRPGSEFLRPVPDTGVYDENGNWTGKFEKEMFDGHEWVNQDVAKLEKELELEFFELDEALKDRDKRQQAILDGLGVKEISETDAQIRADIQAFIASQPPSDDMEITFSDGSTTTWANFKGDYKQVTDDVGMFRRTLGSTEEEIASGITGTVSDVIQSSDIIQMTVSKVFEEEQKGMIGDMILENSEIETATGGTEAQSARWELPYPLTLDRYYYARVKATVQPHLEGGMDGKGYPDYTPFKKVEGTDDEWEIIYQNKNDSSSSYPLRFGVINLSEGVTAQFQVLELYQVMGESVRTILTQLTDSASIMTQNLIGDTLAELGIINSDGYFSGDRFMFTSDVNIHPSFTLSANHIQGNIMELTTASFVAEDGTTYVDPYRVESYAPSNPLKAYPQYREDKIYRTGDMVYFNNRVFRALQDSIMMYPPTGTVNAYWQVVGESELELPPHPGALASMQNGTFFTRSPAGDSMGYLGYLNRNGRDYYALNVSASRNFGIVASGQDVIFEYAHYNDQMQAGRNLSFNSGYGVIQSSDRRLKYDIEPTEVNPEKILEEAEFSSFTYNDSDIHLDIGMVAQDNMDLTVESEDGYLAIDTMKLNYVTAYAVQRLLKRVKELEDQIG